MFEPAHDDSYPSQSDFEACVAMEQCDMSPVIQWPQTVPLQDFHMQPHFGYPVSMPLPDVIDTYPAPHPQTGYPEEVQTAPPLGLELVGSEDFTAQLMQTLCKAAPPLPQQPDHLIQHAGPVISSHPVYPSQITSATGTLIDDHGRRSCVYRMCPAPRSQPLFTTEELDQWAALVRVGPQSLSGEKTLQLKQEVWQAKVSSSIFCNGRDRSGSRIFGNDLPRRGHQILSQNPAAPRRAPRRAPAAIVVADSEHQHVIPERPSPILFGTNARYWRIIT